MESWKSRKSFKGGNHLSHLLATPHPHLSFVRNQRCSVSRDTATFSPAKANTPASWVRGTSGLSFSKRQTVRVCYLIPNRHHVFVRRPWAYFTFSWGKHKPPSISMRKHPKSKALWGLMTLSGIFPFSPGDVCEGRGYGMEERTGNG